MAANLFWSEPVCGYGWMMNGWMNRRNRMNGWMDEGEGGVGLSVVVSIY